MPEISRFYGIIIRMYYNEHNPPHFHADYEGESAEYSIETLELINGSLSKRANSLVLEWASLHKDELIKNWDHLRKQELVNKIEPLD